MLSNTKTFEPFQSFWHRFLEWNPQLFREIKGIFKTRNLVITVCISLIAQLLIVLSFTDKLPKAEALIHSLAIEQGSIYSKYCFGQPAYGSEYLCETDLLNNWVINWQLLWLDIFVWLSICGFFILLVAGTYLLATDIVKEENRGTFNFIRLSPQSAITILQGKIFGVPGLIYLGILLALPLHLISGLNASIPFNLILAFDVAIIAACWFFYSAALLLSLTNLGLSGFKPWLASGLVLFVLCCTMPMIFYNNMFVYKNPFDWLSLFNPGRVFAYLIEASYISPRTADYSDITEFKNLLFYGQALWTKPITGIGFILFNYGLWSYFIWQGLKRRFHNPQSTLLSKKTSYWLTGCFVAVAVGFALQTTLTSRLEENLIIVQCFLSIYFLGLIAALSPHRQTLHDWARYRHQMKREGNLLWKELVFGDKSPSSVAIALNLSLAMVYMLPSLFLFDWEHKTATMFWALLLTTNIILLYAVIAQLMLMIKHQKRAVWSAGVILALIILPPLGLGLLDLTPQSLPIPWLFTFIPYVSIENAATSTILLSILGQWLAIALASLQMTRSLRQAGASETKVLLSER
jgi:hypothetical protein